MKKIQQVQNRYEYGDQTIARSSSGQCVAGIRHAFEEMKNSCRHEQGINIVAIKIFRFDRQRREARTIKSVSVNANPRAMGEFGVR